MDIRTLIHKYLQELPEQIVLLEKACNAMQNAEERQRQVEDIRSYEKRMREGFSFLETLDDETLALIQTIREQPLSLLKENEERYKAALAHHRIHEGVAYSSEQFETLIQHLQTIPLSHSSRNVRRLQEQGIHPASELWLSPQKSTANPMDIVLGLDRYCFFTHGYTLKNFGESYVSVGNELLNLPTTVISTVDMFKLVLMATGKTIPCAAPTHEWISSLQEYSRQLFSHEAFWELKADYILTFFKTADEYHKFAERHFYENHSECAPAGEQPFLGEIKIFGAVQPQYILG